MCPRQKLCAQYRHLWVMPSVGPPTSSHLLQGLGWFSICVFLSLVRPARAWRADPFLPLFVLTIRAVASGSHTLCCEPRPLEPPSRLRTAQSCDPRQARGQNHSPHRLPAPVRAGSVPARQQSPVQPRAVAGGFQPSRISRSIVGSTSSLPYIPILSLPLSRLLNELGHHNTSKLRQFKHWLYCSSLGENYIIRNSSRLRQLADPRTIKLPCNFVEIGLIIEDWQKNKNVGDGQAYPERGID